MQKPLPPYGKPLAQLLSQGLRPRNDVYVFIGEGAWKKGENFHLSYPERTLVLPAWLPAYNYHWPVKDCEMTIVDTGYANEDYITELICELYSHKAREVWLITTEYQLIKYHKE